MMRTTFLEKTRELVSVPELKLLLVTIVDNRLPVCIRYRI